MTRQGIKKPGDRLIFYFLLGTVCFCAVMPFITLMKAEFVHWDDDVYVTDNERVQRGITPENFGWAFSTIYFGFYYPITWLSHMLDCSLFGLWAGGHHLTSILLHAVNSVLVFLFFRTATSDKIKSLFLSCLFAVHPLNVESVAWISERKNLLAALFFFLGINFYLKYVKEPSRWSFVRLFLCFLLGLMSKSNIVMFPFVLILIDVWPLGRLSITRHFLVDNAKLLTEKLLLMIPLPIFGFLTIYAQDKAHALGTFSQYPLKDRLAGAVLAGTRYIGQFFFPHNLTAFYPHLRSSYSSSSLIFGLLLLTAITISAIMLFRKRPVFSTGWLWYLINLLPVIGIIQVGRQASADRYMYLPMIGLISIIIFGIIPLFEKIRFVDNRSLSLVCGIVVVALSFKSHTQALVWQTSETLFSSMIKVSPNASQGHYNMGIIMQDRGDLETAEKCYRKAIECEPEKGEAYNNLGNCLAKKSNYQGAIEQYEKAAKFDPLNPMIRFNWGLAEELLGNKESASKRFEEARQLAAGDERLTKKIEDSLKALRELSSGQEIESKDRQFNDLVEKAMALGYQNRWEEAQAMCEEHLARNPGDDRVWALLGYALQCQGKDHEADAAFSKATELNPAWAGKIGEARQILSSGTAQPDPKGKSN